METLNNTGQGLKKSGGRPRKYREPSRPITVTLPESGLKNLQLIDPDRSRAIVKAAAIAVGGFDKGAVPRVEVVESAKKTGLIIVGPSQALRNIPFLHLVEVAPARHILALNQGHSFHDLEIALFDLLDDLPVSEVQERGLIEQLVARVKELRRNRRVRMAEILFVSMD